MKKYMKIFLIELIIVLIFFAYFFNNKKEEDLAVNYNISTSSLETEYKEDEEKKGLYEKLEKGLLTGDSKIKMDLDSLFTNPKEIFSVLETISYENPEVMYYKGAEYYFGKIKLSYSRSIKDIKSHQKEIQDEKSRFFQNNMRKDMSDYDKILQIHDYIVEKGEYDTRLFSEGEVPPESYSTYGILTLGVGVCESYAKSMKYLLDEAGIESMIVIGTSRGENHAWNLVRIDDEYYHIDATWNDPITEDGSQIIRHNFFNLSDEQIGKTHNWIREDYPKANGEKYNYYNYNGLIARSEGGLTDKLEKALLKRVPKYSLKLLNEKEDIDINKIIEEIGYENYEQIMLSGYNYSLDEEQKIFNFQFYYH